jgi:hypothetical protein
MESGQSTFLYQSKNEMSPVRDPAFVFLGQSSADDAESPERRCSRLGVARVLEPRYGGMID